MAHTSHDAVALLRESAATSTSAAERWQVSRLVAEWTEVQREKWRARRTRPEGAPLNRANIRRGGRALRRWFCNCVRPSSKLCGQPKSCVGCVFGCCFRGAGVLPCEGLIGLFVVDPHLKNNPADSLFCSLRESSSSSSTQSGVSRFFSCQRRKKTNSFRATNARKTHT